MKNAEGRTIERSAPPGCSDGADVGTVARSLLAVTPCIAFFQDLGGRFVVVTPAASRLIGLPTERVEGRTWRDLGVNGGVVGAVEALRGDVLEDGEYLSGELSTDDGSRCFRYRVEPATGPSGDIKGTFTVLEDVTEQRELEELRISESRLRTVMESTSDAVFIKDRQGRHVMVNSATLRVLGKSRDEVLGKTDPEISPDTSMTDRLVATDRRIMESGVGETFEELMLTPDGPRYFLTNKVPYRDGNGQVIGIMGIAQDITDRKLIEDNLRAEERWLRSLVENAPVAIATSRNGLTTYANPRYLELFGYDDPGELLGRPFTEQIAPQDRARGLEFGLGYQEGKNKEAVIELTGLRRDGSLFPFQVALTEVDLGDGLSILGFFTDITERKRAEEEMTNARRKFESLFEASNEGIALHEVVSDPEGRVANYRLLDVNPAYERITGIRRSEAVGRLATDVYGAPEPPYLSEFTSVAKTGKPVSMETYFPPMDKHLFISISSPAKDQFATIFIDISERKRLERELEEAKSRAELYVDLLTHDISNYNTAAMGYLQLAEMRLKLDERDRKLITSPLQVLAYSSELIANIRDLKRVEAGVEKFRPVDVCRILREVKEAYDNPPERDVTIDIDGETDACWTMASSLLRDAFSNIVSNSIKHSKGPVHVWIQVRRARDGGDNVSVSVADDGPGIPDERKGRIFDRSLMGLTKPVSRGLGLYLVKRLVEDINGRVWVEDRVPGDHTKGAKFVVLLPAVPADRPA